MSRNIDEKEIYLLWWKYLQRSTIYSDICNMRAENFECKKASKYSTFWETNKYNYKAYCLAKGKTPEKRLDKEWDMLVENLKIFGDVVDREPDENNPNKKFNQWWNSPYNRIKMRSSRKPPVVDMKDPKFYEEVFYIESFCTDSPSPDEYKLPSPQKLMKEIESAITYMFVAIPLVGETNMEEISSQIVKIKEQYKNKKSVKEADAELRIGFLPTTRIKKKELENYLKVYDLRKKGMKMTDVIKAMAPNKDCKEVDVQRKFYRFQKKAESIIKNVEKRRFPGNY
jgi:hypothetical protein